MLLKFVDNVRHSLVVSDKFGQIIVRVHAQQKSLNSAVQYHIRVTKSSSLGGWESGCLLSDQVFTSESEALKAMSETGIRIRKDRAAKTFAARCVAQSKAVLLEA